MKPNPGFKFWTLEERNGLKFLSFEGWKGVKVFYSTRIGGVSPPPYDTLNLHFGRGDDMKNVKLNRGRFFEAVSVDERNVVYTKQIHSNIVNIVSELSEGLEGDGIITTKKDLYLGVFTADCLALFLYAPLKKIIAVFHIGRRGAERGIVKKGLESICGKFDIEPGDIETLFGPSIGPCCYEVGEEFLGRFDREYLIERENKIYLDMWKMVRVELKKNGVKKILVPELCSCSQNDLFFSYRRSGERVGENLGIIGMTN